MKPTSLQIVRNMGYGKIRSTQNTFTMCDRKHHIIGTQGAYVEPYITAVAIQNKKVCDCWK